VYYCSFALALFWYDLLWVILLEDRGVNVEIECFLRTKEEEAVVLEEGVVV
jgi:hypothetical protein